MKVRLAVVAVALLSLASFALTVHSPPSRAADVSSGGYVLGGPPSLSEAQVALIPTTSAPTTTTEATVVPVVASQRVEAPLTASEHYTSAPCHTGPAFNAGTCEIERYTGDFTEDEIKALLVRVWPDDPVWAVRVAFCESKYNRFATNRNPDRGILQVNWIHTMWVNGVQVMRDNPAVTYDEMFEVGYNLAEARAIYNGQGRGGWSCSRTVGMR